MEELSSAVLFFPSFDCITSNAEGSQGQRHAGVDTRLHQDGANFVLRYAIGESTFDVNTELMVLAHGGQHPDVQEAAGLEGERVITPDGAPAVLGDERLHRFVEIVGG